MMIGEVEVYFNGKMAGLGTVPGLFYSDSHGRYRHGEPYRASLPRKKLL